MSVRRMLASALAALMLAASPVSAAGPATGTWAAMGTAAPMQNPFFEAVLGMKTGPDGNVYAFGWFVNAGGDPTADYLAVYEPASNTWHGLGSNGAGDGALNSPVRAIAWWGSTLFAGGEFIDAGGVTTADYLAAWTGSAWTARPSVGEMTAPFNATVGALLVSGGYLYAGGAFTDASGDGRSDAIVRWDGRNWTPVIAPGALVAPFPASADIGALAAGPDGTIYAGGSTATGALLGARSPITGAWSGLGGPLVEGSAYDTVTAIAPVGAGIYVGGTLTAFRGTATCPAVCRWTGTAWTGLGSDGAGGAAITGNVESIVPYAGTVIVAGNIIGPNAIKGVAAFNGSAWQDLGLGAGSVNGTAIIGRTMYAGGMFADAGGVAAADTVAAYGLPAAPTAPRSVTVATGSGRLMVAWATPASTNGSAVTGYTVQVRKKGATAWRSVNVAAGLRSATVTGLTHGATYDVRVLARNWWGSGTASTVVRRVVP